MKAGLLERIAGVGHWRVVVRPTVPVKEQLSFAKCKEYVVRRRVSLRGWDFPHVNERDDEFGGSGIFTGYFENWVDWHAQWEFWRMYRSGQFISYISLYEDVVGGSQSQSKSISRNIDAIGALYSITEFVEFSFRLMKEAEYKPGVHLFVSLRNTKGRRLSTGVNRMPFLVPKITQADEIILNKKIIGELSDNSAMTTAADFVREFFDHFGWAAEENLIKSEIDRLLTRQI